MGGGESMRRIRLWVKRNEQRLYDWLSVSLFASLVGLLVVFIYAIGYQK